MRTGAELIAEERKRQIEEEKYTELSDKKLMSGQLTLAAVSYCLVNIFDELKAKEFFPWDYSCFKPKSQLKNLIRAGALIAAEIDKYLNA